MSQNSPSNVTSPEDTATQDQNGNGPSLANCPHCQAQNPEGQTYCSNCGWVFGAEAAEGGAVAASDRPAGTVKERYKIGKLISERGDVARYQGTDTGAGDKPVPVVIVQAQAAGSIEPLPEDVVTSEVDAQAADAEVVPEAESATVPSSLFPGLDWESQILGKVNHPLFPAVLDRFNEDGWDYLILEAPQGEILWNVWDDLESSNSKNFGYLIQIADGLRELHKVGAMLESLRPDMFVVSSEGTSRIVDLTELLSLPLPPNPPVRGSMYTAPELVLNPDSTDARAALYSFGAMMYALYIGRELQDSDFDKAAGGTPKPFLQRFPDAHPAFGRLVAKTFVRSLDFRFPSDESAKTDATGMSELIRTLETCKRTLDAVRMEISSWTTTGIVRTGNEDAFALMHAVESSQDDLHDSVLIILCDGMGGYDAGEVASALAIQNLRRILLQHKMFAALSGESPENAEPFDLEKCKQVIHDAMKETNRLVFEAPQKGIGKRGMGCTAEAVYIHGENMVVGHIGDSRTYHLNQGQIVQVTRDQTLVNRLIELGQLTQEEAENHPRRSELQQAVGGRATVDPAVYTCRIKPGDWVLVCTDGLINHVKDDELHQMMLNEADSAEVAARRLVNFANIRGATDNSTVVVVRTLPNQWSPLY